MPHRLMTILAAAVAVTACGSASTTSLVPATAPLSPSSASAPSTVSPASATSAPSTASAPRATSTPGTASTATASARSPSATRGPSSEPVPSPTRSAPAGSPVATVGVGGSFDPGSFTSNVDNPWFPLAPGTTLTYSGTKDGKAARETYRVTNRTKVIHGAECRVVEDQLFLNEKLGEDTIDYYVQDLAGNVWYFGEDTRILDAAGKVTSTEGTWHSGRDGAVAGIFMEATPIVGHSYAQETYTGHAEDHYEVLSVSAAVTVPYGAFSGVVQTKEWTPLEPDVLDHKFWMRGIGEVREASVSGPLEELVLEKVEHH